MKSKLFIDQYRNRFYSTSITALKREQGLPGKIFKIYCDTKAGDVVQTGWGIGAHWFDVYERWEKKV